jgi:hypothetical protein
MRLRSAAWRILLEKQQDAIAASQRLRPRLREHAPVSRALSQPIQRLLSAASLVAVAGFASVGMAASIGGIAPIRPCSIFHSRLFATVEIMNARLA